MSDYVPKDGDLSLFENDKEGNENRPDLTGYALINGEKYSGRIEEPYNGAGSSASNGVSSEVPF